MAPINIPGRVTQGPTLVIANDDVPVTTHTPFIFWIMMVLVGVLVLLFLGVVAFVSLKRSALFRYLVACVRTIKGLQLRANVIHSLKLSTNAVKNLRWNETTMKKRNPILPTSLDPQIPRCVVLPRVNVSVARPCRAFGHSVRDRVHDIQDDLLQKYHDRSEEKKNKWRANHMDEAIADLQLLGDEIKGLRPMRNLQPPRSPWWVRWCLERRPKSTWQIPEIRIWGPGEEPPMDGSKLEHEQLQRRSAIDLTLEELIESHSLTQAEYDALCSKPWTLYKREPLGTPDMDGKDESKCVGTTQEDVLMERAHNPPRDDDIPSNEQKYLHDNATGFSHELASDSSSTLSSAAPSLVSVVLEDHDDYSDGSSSPRTPVTAGFGFAITTASEVGNCFESRVPPAVGMSPPNTINSTILPFQSTKDSAPINCSDDPTSRLASSLSKISSFLNFYDSGLDDFKSTHTGTLHSPTSSRPAAAPTADDKSNEADLKSVYKLRRTSPMTSRPPSSSTRKNDRSLQRSSTTIVEHTSSTASTAPTPIHFQRSPPSPRFPPRSSSFPPHHSHLYTPSSSTRSQTRRYTEEDRVVPVSCSSPPFEQSSRTKKTSTHSRTRSGSHTSKLSCLREIQNGCFTLAYTASQPSPKSNSRPRKVLTKPPVPRYRLNPSN